VQHRHPAGAGERDRQAVGHEHEQREAGDRRRVRVGLDQRRRDRPVPLHELGAVHLMPVGRRLGADAPKQPPPVLPHPALVVVGEEAEVERRVRGLAHAAEPGREVRPGPREGYFEQGRL
jgi:hypothetical protein